MGTKGSRPHVTIWSPPDKEQMYAQSIMSQYKLEQSRIECRQCGVPSTAKDERGICWRCQADPTRSR